jgi:hypothetical protein
MTRNSLPLRFAILAIAAAAVYGLGFQSGARAANANRVFELRTYYTLPGKLENLKARFRDHTTRLFEKHGMTNIGYWVPQDEPKSQNTLIYVLAFPSREAAKKSWDGFRSDPEWKKAQAESEKSGKIVERLESVYMDPVDFSKLK